MHSAGHVISINNKQYHVSNRDKSKLQPVNDTISAIDWEIDNIISYGAFEGYDLIGKLLQKVASTDKDEQILTYKDFPDKVRYFVKEYYAKQIEQDPELVEHINSLRVVASERPMFYDDTVGAEYVDTENVILSYIPVKDLFEKYPEGLVHELDHVVQFYLKSIGKEASIPAAGDPRYLNDSKFYLEDKAEIKARAAEKAFEKLSWKIQEFKLGDFIRLIKDTSFISATISKGSEGRITKILYPEATGSDEIQYGVEFKNINSRRFFIKASDLLNHAIVIDRVFSSLKDKNEQLFNERYQRYGDDGANLFWSDKTNQYARFKALSQVGDLSKASVLDVGAGYGDLLDFAQEYGIDIGHYVGVDIIPAIIEVAERKHPYNKFEVRDIVQQPYADDSFDFVLGSGLFALEDEQWEQSVFDIISAMYKIARKGVAVNFLKGQGNVDGFRNTTEEEVKNIVKNITENIEVVSKLSDDITLYLYK